MTTSEQFQEVISTKRDVNASKPANLQRAEWRNKARHVLADHLYTQLGVSVKPADVRLIPRAGDGYVWTVLPEKQYLFSKQLSKHSIGAYMELCRGIGVFFEASANSEPGKASSAVPQGKKNMATAYSSMPEISFMSRIHNLQAEHDRLARELDYLHQKNREELVTKQDKDKIIQQLQLDLRLSRKYQRQLEHEINDLSSNTKYFESRVAESGKALSEALSVLRDLSSEPPISQWRKSVIAISPTELEENHISEELE